MGFPDGLSSSGRLGQTTAIAVGSAVARRPGLEVQPRPAVDRGETADPFPRSVIMAWAARGRLPLKPTAHCSQPAISRTGPVSHEAGFWVRHTPRPLLEDEQTQRAVPRSREAILGNFLAARRNAARPPRRAGHERRPDGETVALPPLPIGTRCHAMASYGLLRAARAVTLSRVVHKPPVHRFLGASAL